MLAEIGWCGGIQGPHRLREVPDGCIIEAWWRRDASQPSELAPIKDVCFKPAWRKVAAFVFGVGFSSGRFVVPAVPTKEKRTFFR